MTFRSSVKFGGSPSGMPGSTVGGKTTINTAAFNAWFRSQEKKTLKSEEALAWMIAHEIFIHGIVGIGDTGQDDFSDGSEFLSSGKYNRFNADIIEALEEATGLDR